jgi:hypothetical protein
MAGAKIVYFAPSFTFRKNRLISPAGRQPQTLFLLHIGQIKSFSQQQK